MKRVIALAGLLSLASTPAIAEEREYTFDKSHTSIRATWDHQGFSMMALQLTDYDGSITIDLDEPSQNAVSVTFNLAGGIWAGAEQDRFLSHLASADLLNLDAFPTASFEATEFVTEDGQTGTMIGDLTLLGQTHPVSMFVELRKAADIDGGHKIGVTANTTISRSEWDLTYAVPHVSDWIAITIEAELVSTDD